MSPPEIWGPAVWILFHTLLEKVDNYYYLNVYRSMFRIISRICLYLPCPDCASHANKFLIKLKTTDIQTKEKFKNVFYLFHNIVNAKKRKKLFNYININIYSRYNLIYVINNFIKNYNTKGNMNLIAESFQRELIIKDFKKWFLSYSKIFIKPDISRKINSIREKTQKELEQEIVTAEENQEEISPTKESESKTINTEESKPETEISATEESKSKTETITTEEYEQEIVITEEHQEEISAREESELDIVTTEEGEQETESIATEEYKLETETIATEECEQEIVTAE